MRVCEAKMGVINKLIGGRKSPLAKKGKEVRPDLETSKDEDEVEAENSPSKEENAAAVDAAETPAKTPAKTPMGLEKTVLDAAGTWKKKLVKVWNPKGEAGKLKGSSDEEEDAESVEDTEPPMDPKEAVLEGLRARQKKLAKAKAKAKAKAEAVAETAAKAESKAKAKAKAKNSAGKKGKAAADDAEPSMDPKEVVLEGLRARQKKLAKAKAKAEVEAKAVAETAAKAESKAKAKKSAGKKEKTESEDVAPPPMTSEEIILEGMRIRKRKLAEAAEREKEKAFAREVEAVVESEKEKNKQENKEDEQSIKEKNEGIILEAMKLRKQRLDEEKQAAGEAAATKKKKPSAKKKAASAEPEPEAPNSREDLIRKAMQIREEKQELLGDVDPELREKLSQAVMAKFKKINKGEW